LESADDYDSHSATRFIANVVELTEELAPGYAAIMLKRVRPSFVVCKDFVSILCAAPTIISDPASLQHLTLTAAQWMELKAAYSAYAMGIFDNLEKLATRGDATARELLAEHGNHMTLMALGENFWENLKMGKHLAEVVAKRGDAKARELVEQVAKEASKHLGQWTMQIAKVQAADMEDTEGRIARLEAFLTPVRIRDAAADMDLEPRAKRQAQ
jgi:hypothetical protein